MTQKPKEEQEEEEEEEEGLWQRIVRSVRENPLRYKPEQELRQEVKADREEVKAEEEEARKRSVERSVRVDASPFVAEAEKQPQEEASRGKGLDKRTARRLRRGEMAIDARLDLHGLRRGQAREFLCSGLRRYYERGFRCVLVISGKGRGIVREEMMLVLDSAEIRDIVVEHKEARVKDGGEGARYVLLRRKRS